MGSRRPSAAADRPVFEELDARLLLSGVDGAEDEGWGPEAAVADVQGGQWCEPAGGSATAAGDSAGAPVLPGGAAELDGPQVSSFEANVPIGEAQGIHAGRVVWTRDPLAAAWDGSTGHWWDDANTDPLRVAALLSDGLRWLTGQAGDLSAWNALFCYFNQTHGGAEVGYAPGEKIAIKVNLNNSTSQTDADNQSDASPQLVLALLHQLIDVAGVAPGDITVYDAARRVPARLYDPCHAAYPDVVWVDSTGGGGRTAAQADLAARVRYGGDAPDSTDSYLPTCVTQAKYLINMALLKGHDLAGVTQCAKNLFGSIRTLAGTWTPSALHDYVNQTRAMGTYNALVDLMGHEQLGGKTLLYMIDGLYGAYRQGSVPTRWSTFGSNWPGSLLLSQDPVAIDSVGLDFIRAEWTTSSNSDNYLHEAATAEQVRPWGSYDPEGDGTGLASLGVHEHWDSPTSRQYTRNLGTGDGIELVSSDPGTNAAPTVSITTPVEGQTFPAGADIAIAAAAGDTDGSVVRVEFFQNGLPLALDEDGTDGWGLTWQEVSPGAYALRAKATDDLGGIDWSDTVNILVGTTVTIEATDAVASETGDAGLFTLYRVGDMSAALDVALSVGGSAAPGWDYQPIATIATIPAGSDRVYLPVAPIDDDVLDGLKTVTVTLLAGAGYGVGSADQATVTIADDEVPADLLAWWSFDVSDGPLALDASGHGRDLTIVGAVRADDGRQGKALQLDGVDDYAVDEDGEDYLNGLSAITVAMWIKSDVLGTDRGFLTTRDPGSSSCLNIRHDLDGSQRGADNTFKAYLNTTEGNRQFEGEANTQRTDWQHVTLTWTSGGAMAFYLDGVLQDLTYNSGAIGGTINNATRILVGQGYRATDGAWDGLIDDVRLYSRALSGEEIQHLVAPSAEVVGRHVFYNGSAFDGGDAAPNAADDEAVATDKRALEPGGEATFANYTSYNLGLNGVMVDIAGLWAPASIEASDFEFMVGNSDDLGEWSPAPPPVVVDVREVPGVLETHRVTLIWADNAIEKCWLRVEVKANDHTGLDDPNVFYFGSAIGECGNEPGSTSVDSGDRLGARANPRGAFNPAPIDFPYDYNHDRMVDSGDRLIARANATSAFTCLKLITAPPAVWPPAAPEAAGESAGVADGDCMVLALSGSKRGTGTFAADGAPLRSQSLSSSPAFLIAPLLDAIQVAAPTSLPSLPGRSTAQVAVPGRLDAAAVADEPWLFPDDQPPATVDILAAPRLSVL